MVLRDLFFLQKIIFKIDVIMVESGGREGGGKYEVKKRKVIGHRDINNGI